MSSSAVDFSRTLGFRFPDQPVSWRRRDLLLYAIGIGSGPDDLSYVYEASPSFRAFPTYPLVLGLKGDADDTNVFADRIKHRGALPGFPKLDPNTIVHGEQSLRVLKPIPTSSGPSGWKLQSRVSAVHDKGKALILENETSLVSPSGEVHAVVVGATFYRGGGQGTGFSKSLSSPDARPSSAPPKLDTKGKAPDFELEETISPAQAALYRLSGDYNPLHIDPSIGKRVGLGGVILHGLCSNGFAARALLRAYDPHDGQPAHEARVELEFISARFTSPVRLGDTLLTRVWKADGGAASGWCGFEQVVLKPDGSLGASSLRGVAKLKLAPAPDDAVTSRL